MINPLNLVDFHELIYFYVEHVLVRKIAEIPEDKRAPTQLPEPAPGHQRQEQERDEGQEAPKHPER